jgi:hypothetical protein
VRSMLTVRAAGDATSFDGVGVLVHPASATALNETSAMDERR